MVDCLLALGVKGGKKLKRQFADGELEHIPASVDERGLKSGEDKTNHDQPFYFCAASRRFKELKHPRSPFKSLKVDKLLWVLLNAAYEQPDFCV